MDLLRRTSSILISYRHGPLLDAYLSVMKRRIQVQEEATTWGLWSSCARPLGTKSQPALKSIDPTTKDSQERRRRSFVRAVVRTICSRLFGLGWSTRFPKGRTTALQRSLLRRSLPLVLNDPIQFTSLFVRQAPCSCEELRLRELGPRIVFTR